MVAGRAGSHSQGHHGDFPAVPHIGTGSPPTFHGTSSQAHLLAMTLTCAILFHVQGTVYKLLTIVPATVGSDEKSISLLPHNCMEKESLTTPSLTN